MAGARRAGSEHVGQEFGFYSNAEGGPSEGSGRGLAPSRMGDYFGLLDAHPGCWVLA